MIITSKDNPLIKTAHALLTDPKKNAKKMGQTVIDDRLFPYTTTDRKQGRAKFMMTLKRLEFNQTLHGFRHIASTTLNNHTDENSNKFDKQVIKTAPFAIFSRLPKMAIYGIMGVAD